MQITKQQEKIVMKDKKNKNEKFIKKHTWLASLTINVVILGLVLIFTNLTYETNDDFAVAQEIVAGYPYVGFINYYLCKILIAIQSSFPKLNMFILAQLLMSFTAFVVLLKTYLDKASDAYDILIASMICGFFSFDHYTCLQFTKTAALLMASGLIWAADNYIGKRRLTSFAGSFTLFYMGALLRQEGMFPALGYVGAFVMLWWLQNGRELLKERKPAKEMALILVILAIILTPYGINKLSYAKNSETEELKNAREFQDERILVTDYPIMGYESNKEKYDAIGIDDFDLYLIDRWILDYDGAASTEKLRAINEINREYIKSKMTIVRALKKSILKLHDHMKARDFTGIHIIIVCALAIYVILAYKPKSWIYVIAFGVLTMLIISALYYLQRAQYRALYLAEISSVLWILFSAMSTEKRKNPIIRASTAVMLLIVILLMIEPAMIRLESRRNNNVGAVEDVELTKYFEEHPDQFFVIPTTTAGMPESYKNPLAIPTSLENVTDTGGWDTMTPYRLERLKKCGNITNPIRDLIDNPNGIYVGKYKIPAMKDYYNKWHCKEDEQVEFVRVGNVKGVELYSVKRIKK